MSEAVALFEAEAEDKGKIRILAAMDVYLPMMDGVVNCMHNLLLSYPQDVCATAAGPKAKDHVDDYPYPILRYRSFRVPFSKVDFGFPSRDKEFVDEIMHMDIDLIHIHSPFGICKLLTKVAKKRNIPIVATFHTNYRYVFKKILLLKCFYEPYIRTLGKRYGKMDMMFAGTEATAAQLRSFGYQGECRIVPFGTSFVPPDNYRQLRENADARFGLDKEDRVFCFVGRTVRSKRVQFTLDALKKVRDQGYEFRFIVGGTGNYLNAIKRKVKRLKLEDCVTVTGYLSEEELAMVYCRSELLLFPSILDNFALVKVEAAAFNTPGLFLRNSNTAFGTTDMRNAILADNTVDDFADKIIWAIEHPREMREIAQNARNELYFSWKRSAELYAEQYRKVIAEYKAKHASPSPSEKQIRR